MMMNRRQLLNAAGLGAGTLFLPSLLGDKKAYAVDAKRLGIFWTQMGPGYTQWKMRRPGVPDVNQDWEFPLGTVTEAEFSKVLKPLYAYRDDILVLDGLCMMSGMLDPHPQGVANNNHNMGHSHMLTGTKSVRNSGFNNDGQGGAASIDQIIGKKNAVPGRISSLFYSSAYAPWCPSFVGPNQPATAEFSPIKAFNRLFPTGTTVTGGAPTTDDLAGKSWPRALDRVNAEYIALAKRLSGEDRMRLEQHRDFVSALELQIKARDSGGMMVGCTVPAKPTVDGYGNDAPGKPLRTAAFMSLATAALSCDLSRVALVDSGNLAASDFGASNNDVHTNIAHAVVPGNKEDGQMGDYYKVHAAEFARWVGQFKSAGLLDSSLLLWITEIADGAHNLNRLLVVAAGKAGGAFRPGRYVKYGETNPNPASVNFGSSYFPGINPGRCNVPVGPAHSQLLISILQTYGVDVNSLGGFTQVTGCTGSTRGTVDMTGPLARLK